KDNIQKLMQEADDLKASLHRSATQRDHKLGADVVVNGTQIIDRTVQSVINMAKLNDIAASTAGDSPQHKQAFQSLQDNSHATADVITQIGELGYGKIKIGPDYWARQREQWV